MLDQSVHSHANEEHPNNHTQHYASGQSQGHLEAMYGWVQLARIYSEHSRCIVAAKCSRSRCIALIQAMYGGIAHESAEFCRALRLFEALFSPGTKSQQQRGAMDLLQAVSCTYNNIFHRILLRLANSLLDLHDSADGSSHRTSKQGKGVCVEPRSRHGFRLI